MRSGTPRPRLYAYERALARRGLCPVAGIDEAGRGACAGPLVVAAVVLGRAVPGLADSKALTPRRRAQVFEEIVARAEDWTAVVIPAEEIDRVGLHACNIAGMRRALARLRIRPGYALTDGFAVTGLGVPSLAICKGDQVAACVAAASIVAKVTRDRIMTEIHAEFPDYDFAAHKGYVTPGHAAALVARGPCPQHRLSFLNVARAAASASMPHNETTSRGEAASIIPADFDRRRKGTGR